MSSGQSYSIANGGSTITKGLLSLETFSFNSIKVENITFLEATNFKWGRDFDVSFKDLESFKTKISTLKMSLIFDFFIPSI